MPKARAVGYGLLVGWVMSGLGVVGIPVGGAGGVSTPLGLIASLYRQVDVVHYGDPVPPGFRQLHPVPLGILANKILV